MTHPPANAPGNPPTARRPGCLWYLLSIPIFLAGVTAAISIMFFLLLSEDSGQADFVNVPGRDSVFLRKIGLYYIVADKQQTLMNGATSSQGEPSDILVTLHSKSSGRAMPLLREAGTDDKTGRTTLTFNNVEMGAFLITATYRDGAREPAARLKITSAFTASAISKMTTAGVMLFLGLVGPIVLIVYIAFRRSKARNAS
jgi:hypothetical protein